MRTRDAERGQSSQIGFVLLFAVLILVATGYQAVIIPNQNRQVEFKHNQEVQSDMQNLRSGVLRTASTGNSYTATVQLGTRYPSRTLFLNPAPATGTIHTVNRQNVSVVNATAIRDETADYWNGTNNTFRTTGVKYSPSYNIYDKAPTTVYGSSVLYNEFDDATILITGQSFIDGRQITLVTVNGSLSRAQTRSTTIDPRPASAPPRQVAVTDDGSSNVTIKVPIEIPNGTEGESGTVGELLQDEYPATEAGNYVVNWSCASSNPCGLLTVNLSGDATYNLRLARTQVGNGESTVGFEYLAEIDGNASGVPESGTQRLVVEARDRFNNPHSGESLTANITTTSPNGTIRTKNLKTDAEGRAVFVYEAPGLDPNSDPTRKKITVEVAPEGEDCGGENDPECVQFTLWVSEVDGEAP